MLLSNAYYLRSIRRLASSISIHFNFDLIKSHSEAFSDCVFCFLSRTEPSATLDFSSLHFMETMNELAGYMSSDQDGTLNSPMQDSSSEDEGPNSSTSKAKVNPAHSVNLPKVQAPISIKRFDFIPMRLTETERKYLQVLENALEVCEYTDVVDVTFSHTKKSKLSRILESLVDVLSISCGLLVSLLLIKDR